MAILPKVRVFLPSESINCESMPTKNPLDVSVADYFSGCVYPSLDQHLLPLQGEHHDSMPRLSDRSKVPSVIPSDTRVTTDLRSHSEKQLS